MKIFYYVFLVILLSGCHDFMFDEITDTNTINNNNNEQTTSTQSFNIDGEWFIDEKVVMLNGTECTFDKVYNLINDDFLYNALTSEKWIFNNNKLYYKNESNDITILRSLEVLSIYPNGVIRVWYNNTVMTLIIAYYDKNTMVLQSVDHSPDGINRYYYEVLLYK